MREVAEFKRREITGQRDHTQIEALGDEFGDLQRQDHHVVGGLKNADGRYVAHAAVDHAGHDLLSQQPVIDARAV